MFKDRNGLVTSNQYGNIEENSILYTVELFVLRRKKGLPTLEIESVIENALILMDLKDGYYKQNPEYPPSQVHRSKLRYMSHDNLTAIIIYFKMTEQEHRIKKIMDAFRFGISYNNTRESSLRVYHPRDLIFYHILNGSKIAWLFLPLLYIITMFTFMRSKKVRPHGTFNKTDNEILHYIKREVTNIFKPIDLFCDFMIKFRFGNWNNVFATYFNVNHPINLLLKEDL